MGHRGVFVRGGRGGGMWTGPGTMYGVTLGVKGMTGQCQGNENIRVQRGRKESEKLVKIERKERDKYVKAFHTYGQERNVLTNPTMNAIFLSTLLIENSASAVRKSAFSSRFCIIFCSCSVDTSS